MLRYVHTLSILRFSYYELQARREECNGAVMKLEEEVEALGNVEHLNKQKESVNKLCKENKQKLSQYRVSLYERQHTLVL